MLNDEVAKALKVLQNGGIILYPTDTIWGIGCDAGNEDAVKKIYALKQREESKSMIVLLDSENKLLSYVNEVPDIAYDLIEYAENPLTLVMPGAKNISPALISSDGSVGIRISKHPFCQQLGTFHRPRPGRRAFSHREGRGGSAPRRSGWLRRVPAHRGQRHRGRTRPEPPHRHHHTFG